VKTTAHGHFDSVYGRRNLPHLKGGASRRRFPTSSGQRTAPSPVHNFCSAINAPGSATSGGSSRRASASIGWIGGASRQEPVRDPEGDRTDLYPHRAGRSLTRRGRPPACLLLASANPCRIEGQQAGGGPPGRFQYGLFPALRKGGKSTPALQTSPATSASPTTHSIAPGRRLPHTCGLKAASTPASTSRSGRHCRPLEPRPASFSQVRAAPTTIGTDTVEL